MKGFDTWARRSAWTAAAMLVLQPAALFAQGPAAATIAPAAKAIDVKLNAHGALSGQVVSPQGQPIAGVAVAVANAKAPTFAVTDQQGQFRLDGLRGGVHQLQIGNSVQTCRAWTAQAAPPSAVPGLLVVQDSRVVLAQHCGSPVACGLAGCKEALANPLVVGGLIAAAIAIPVAIHNADDDDPAS